MCMCMFMYICIWWINLLNTHFYKLIFGDNYFSNTKKKSVQSIINDKVVENSFFLASQLPASVKLNNALFPDPTAKLI